MIGLRLVACLAATLAAGIAGCGDDDTTTRAPTPASPRGPVAAGNPNASKSVQLVEKAHIENNVSCPIPERPSDPQGGKCDPKAPGCPEHLYCLTLAQGSYCEPCPERDGIRHAFKERDFAVEQNRDPFQSYLLLPTLGRDTSAVQIDPTRRCPREDQMVASSFSYGDLKLVGIVAQGTLRKALMVGGAREGYIIKRGDCVGKEKAFVKDIGTGYITFVIDPDSALTGQRAPEEYSVQLNPKQLAVANPALPAAAPRTTITPVVPGQVTPPRAPPGPPRSPAAAPGTNGSGSAAEAPPVLPRRP
ncbi:MAG TPA: hypothetical protein VFT22_12010 [Kofleriaceae bacterium]|nr:hypothetical protein [Kofleriaceae bacterium]